MITSTVSTEIACPRSVVFEHITDPDKFALWQQGVTVLQAESGLPAGSFIELELIFLGRKSKVRTEILENDGQGRLRSKARRGPVDFQTVVDIAELKSGGTRVTMMVKISAGAIYKLAEPALESITKTVLVADLSVLKVLLEQN